MRSSTSVNDSSVNFLITASGSPGAVVLQSFRAKKALLLLSTTNYGGQRPQIGRVIPLYYLCCVNNARKVYYKLYYSSITIYFHLKGRRCGGVMCGGREKTGVGGGSQLHNEILRKIRY